MKTALAALLLMSGIGSAQEEGKKKRGPMGLPTSADLKEKCAFDDEQAKKADEVLASYKDKLDEAQKKIKEAEDRKAAAKEAGALRSEVVGKLREICKDDEQKKKFDEATAKPAKKKQEKT